MNKRSQLKSLLNKNNRRLNILKEKEALYGLGTPVSVLIEIADTEEEIRKLMAELDEIEKNKQKEEITTRSNFDKKNHGTTIQSMQDSTAIAAKIVALLSKYLVSEDEVVASKFGEGSREKAAEISEKIRTRFSEEADDYLLQTLRRFEEQPNSRKGALLEVLEEVLGKDPDLARSLERLLQQGVSEADAGVTFNVSVFGGEVDEIINVNKIEGGLTINKKD